MLLLLEWADSTPNAHLSAMKSLGSQLVMPLSTQTHFHLEFNHKFAKNHEEPVSYTPFILIPSLKLSKQVNISKPKFISAAL